MIMAPSNRIRVLVVDDSALMRQMISALLAADSALEVVGTAPDPYVAREKIKALNPDVLTLDVEMPRMDGIAFLERLMSLHPMPVVMVSTLTLTGADVTLRALELGAVDVFCKPAAGESRTLAEMGPQLVEMVKSAARARVRALGERARPQTRVADVYRTNNRLVAIGASTGGVEALRDIITVLPADSPPVVVTQHMPPKFTASFAQRLDGMAAVSVCEAEDNQPIMFGHVYIAPGDRHLTVRRSGASYVTCLHDGPLVSGHRPSVDVLFASVAEMCGAAAVGVLLTGMGRDGAQGLLSMRQAGAATIGEDESSCVVYGMPRAAKELGAVQFELPLPLIPSEILRLCSEPGRKGVPS